MLNWTNKKSVDQVKSFPTQLMEVFDPEKKSKSLVSPTFDHLSKKWTNLLFHGDNMEILGYMLENGFRGKVDLIYIDPPFDSGANYIRQVQLRGIRGGSRLSGEEYTVGEQIQYHDIWTNDAYLQFMYERLLLMKELLSENGSIFLQCDWHKSHHLRCLLDEVFGDGGEDGKGPGFKSEIIWNFNLIGGNAKKFEKNHETIFWYTKSSKYTFNKDSVRQPYSESFLKSLKPDADGNLTYSRGLGRDGAKLNRKASSKINPLGKSPSDIWDDIEKEWAPEVWNDIKNYNVSRNESTSYPTQKPEKLIERIVLASSNPEDIVLDCFMGSGTTAAVAQKNGRKWIGCDINRGSIQETSNRLQKIILADINEKTNQTKIDNEEIVKTKFNSFSHYKVNDYDLQILKTEAEDLVKRHLGIEPNAKDLFFEGILENKLVKIIDFGHPCTLLDLQLIQDEIKKRPNEDREITVVCLGKEISVDNWIEDYNKKHPVNKIEIKELRTDASFGKLLVHKSPEAKIDIKRNKSSIKIEIKNFISHSIVERLTQPETLVEVKIEDFRSMINAVFIDTEYDGKVFVIKHSDVPEKRTGLIEGKYEIPISKSKTIIAIKITDMLGEEILVTKEI